VKALSPSRECRPLGARRVEARHVPEPRKFEDRDEQRPRQKDEDEQKPHRHGRIATPRPVRPEHPAVFPGSRKTNTATSRAPSADTRADDGCRGIGRHSRTLAQVCDPSPVDAADRSLVQRAWKQAADNLGIEVHTDAALTGGDEVVVLVRAFGRDRGTAVFTPGASSDARRTAEEQGFFVSVLSNAYEHYDRELFTDTLNDWQWFGPGAPPEWYTGEPWSR
jgi:hypothetical protein